MLVLSRKLNEEIVIDGQVVVKVVAINGHKVRLGIKAPPRVRVNRREVEDHTQEAAGRPPPNGEQVVHLSTAEGRSSLEDQLDAVVAGSGESVALDFTGVGHICSTGLGKVVGLHCRVAAAGGHLLLQNLGPLVREVFSGTTLDGFLALPPSP